MSFIKYLKSLHTLKPNANVIVTGNQSVDMDSFCSAILTAFFTSNTESNPGPVIPLIPINRDDMRLRKDILFILQKLSIDPAWLLFIDDIKLTPHTSLFLVDHNSQFLQGHVTSIIDHHQIEDPTKDPSKAVPVINPLKIVKCGSCMSAVINYFKQFPELDVLFNENKELPVMALSPIVLDTANLKARVESEDVDAVEFLSKFSLCYSPSMNFAEIIAEKSSLSGLTIQDLLKKDYKQWGKLGISSIPATLHKLLKTISYEDIAEGMENYRKSQDLEFLVAMGSGGGKRDLAYLGPPHFDIADECPDLQLKLREDKNGVKMYTQENVTATRKVVAPLLREAIEKITK